MEETDKPIARLITRARLRV